MVSLTINEKVGTVVKHKKSEKTSTITGIYSWGYTIYTDVDKHTYRVSYSSVDSYEVVGRKEE